MKPIALIASTSEGRPFAEALEKKLKSVCACRRWDKGIFEAGGTQQASLLAWMSASDFVVVILTADDRTVSRGKEFFSSRDNLIFEAGMSFGANAPGRTMLIPELRPHFKLPSDLNGFTTTVAFDGKAAPTVAMDEPATQIRDRVRAMGIRPKSGIQLAKRDLVRFNIDLVRSSSRNILMFGRDLSWADEYHAALEERIANDISVEVFCEHPQNASWQANVDRLVKAGANVRFLRQDFGLRLTMIDTHDPNICRFVMMSKQRRASGVLRKADQQFTYTCDIHDAPNSMVLWQTLMNLYKAIEATPFESSVGGP